MKKKIRKISTVLLFCLDPKVISNMTSQLKRITEFAHVACAKAYVSTENQSYNYNLNESCIFFRFLLACDTKEDRVTWVNCLNEALCDMKAWTNRNKGPLYPELGHVGDKNVHM
jgi:hypothetical protein